MTMRASEGRSFEWASSSKDEPPCMTDPFCSLTAMTQAEATDNGYLEWSEGAVGYDRGWAQPLIQLNHGESRGRA